MKKIILIIGVLAIGAVAGEYLVRNAPVLLPVERQVRLQAILSKDRVAPDPEIGFVRAKGYRELVSTLDYTYLRETDKHGFPNRAEWPSRADVVVLGDSLVMGEGTGLQNGFVELFAREVSAATVNLGVAGAGPERQRLIYAKYGESLRPRVVMSFLFLAADITNDEHFRAWKEQAPRADYNAFRLNYASRQDRRPAFHPGRLLARSRLVDALKSLVASDNGEKARAGDGQEVYLERRAIAFLDTRPSATDEAVRRFVDAVSGMHEAVTRGGARFIVVMIPSKEEVLGKTTALPEAIKPMLKDKGIPFIDLHEPLEHASRTGSPYYKRDIHLNEFGNKVVARFLVGWYKGEDHQSNLQTLKYESEKEIR